MGIEEPSRKKNRSGGAGKGLTTVVFLALISLALVSSAVVSYPMQIAYAASTLTVNGFALDGKPMSMWISVQTNGSTVATGFTPLTFAGATGSTYSVSAHDYVGGNVYFDHWEDGSTGKTRTISLSSDRTIAAYYRTTSTHNLVVNSATTTGDTLTGYYTTIRTGNTTVKTGFTSLTYAGNHDSSYTISVSDYGKMVFDHWEDGSTSRARTLTLNADTSVTAYLRDTSIVKYELTVQTADLTGNSITGYYTTLKEGSTTVMTGFTPLVHEDESGTTLTVTVADYDSMSFDHWENGSTTRVRTVSLSSDTTITAYYKSSTASPPPTPANSNPNAADDFAETNQDQSVVIDVLTNDSDADGDILSITYLTSPSNGTGANNLDGTVTYVPYSGFSGTDMFDYTVSDGKGGSATATVMVTVLSTEAPPVSAPELAPAMYEVAVNSADMSGNSISGYEVTFQSDTGSTDQSTPFGFTGIAGSTYVLTPKDGTDMAFDHWENGSTDRSRTIILEADVTVTAHYRALPPPPTAYTMTVGSADMSGKSTSGLYTVIRQGTTTVKTGFTPLAFVGDAGATYSVSVSDYGSSLFDHWENGSTTRARTLTLSSDMTLTAYYRVPTLSLSPTSGLGGTTITAAGMYFSPNSSVTLTYGGTIVKSATSNLAGSFSTSFVAPSAGAGFYTVFATDAKGWKASAVFEDTTAPEPSPIKDLIPKTGVVVALYMYPGTTGSAHWQTVIDEKTKHPSVPVVAVFNPSSGPGDAKDNNIANWVAKLRNAGVIAIGYTHDDYGARPLSALKADADKYKNWYNADGLFIDEFTNKVGSENHYRDLTEYAKSLGMKMTLGNPGTDVPKSYIGTVDVINITEGKGYMPISWLQYCVNCSASDGWHYQYDKRNFSFIRYDIDTLDTDFVTEASKWVGLMYIHIGSDVDGRWFNVPPYFGTLVATLDR